MGYYNQDELQNTIGTLMSDTIYDNLNEYYLNYSYSYTVQEDIKPFIAGLNNLFGKLADDEEFIYVSTHLQDDKEITEE